MRNEIKIQKMTPISNYVVFCTLIACLCPSHNQSMKDVRFCTDDKFRVDVGKTRNQNSPTNQIRPIATEASILARIISHPTRWILTRIR